MARTIRAPRALFAALLIALAVPAAGHADPPSQDIGTAAGPLTRVAIGNELSCQVKHVKDRVNEFFPSNKAIGDCGTLVAVDGQVFAPDWAAHDLSSVPPNLGAYTAFTPVSQTGPTGAGTAVDPRRVVTTVDLGTTGIRLVQTDAYAGGGESYRTDVSVQNTSGAPKAITLYRAVDCHLQDRDDGFGFTKPGGAVGCSETANNSPAGRIQELVPITGSNTWFEGAFHEVWKQVATQGPLPNACARCAESTDNAAAIAWSLTAADGAPVSRAHYTTFSPTSNTGAPDSLIAPPGSSSGGTDSGGGVQIGIDAPRGCVRKGGNATVRITSTRKRRLSADRFGFVRRVKILRVYFYVNGGGRIVDTKAAFSARFLASTLAADRDHELSAVVILQRLRTRGKQVRIGKRFSVKVSSTLTICP